MSIGNAIVTVAVAVYNVENYIEECIQSILNQTYSNLEIIIVNDGSTDNSLHICNMFLYDKRCKIINKPNEGLSSARQLALDMATGKYICFVDSDDYIEPNFIDVLIKLIHDNYSDISICASTFFTKKNSFTNYQSITNVINKKITDNDLVLEFASIAGQFLMYDSWARLYKTEFIKQSGVKFTLEKQYNGTDSQFNLLLLMSLPTITITSNALYNHRIHKESRVHRKNKNLQLGLEKILDSLIIKSKSQQLSSSIFNQLSIIYLNFLIISTNDILTNERRFINVIHNIRTIHCRNSSYLQTHPEINIDVKNLRRISDKIFALLFKNQSILFLYTFLKIRQLKINKA